MVEVKSEDSLMDEQKETVTNVSIQISTGSSDKDDRTRLGWPAGYESSGYGSGYGYGIRDY